MKIAKETIKIAVTLFVGEEEIYDSDEFFEIDFIAKEDEETLEIEIKRFQMIDNEFNSLELKLSKKRRSFAEELVARWMKISDNHEILFAI